MTSNTSPLIPSGDATADSSEIERSVILNLIPDAAVIYNRSTDQILAINYAFQDLTDHLEANLFGKSLAEILPEETDTNPLVNARRPVLLNTATGTAIQVGLTIHSLNRTNQQVIFLFYTAKPGLYIKTDLIAQELFYDNYAQVTKISKQPDLHSVFSFVIDLVEKITHANCIGIYKSSTKESSLECIAQVQNISPAFLPESLSTQDLVNLEKPLIWKEGRKITTSLHGLAQKACFKYLATVPLGQAGAWIGLIVVAGQAPIPSDEVLRFLSLLGMETANIMEHHIAIENARKTIQKIKQVIQIEHTVIDNLEEGVIILTPDLRIAEMNPAAEIILGYASKEVFRQPIEAILIGTETLSSAFNTALQGISTLVSSDLKLHNRTGKSFPAQVLTIPVKVDQQLISIIILLRDISQTEQIRARTQQLEQRAFLGEVSAVFAHEVKNPINSIMTGLQFIGMSMEKDAPHLELVNRLQNDCLRLTHLMDSVLTFSKPVEYHLVPVDLNSIIPVILDRWVPRMHRLNINPYFETIQEHPQVIGDSRALEQVFVNLISNAVQAMDVTGGSLSIKIQETEQLSDPPHLEIIISDSGPGIPDEIREHIFEPFMTTNPNGTGLGLAISKRIVIAHKGNIFVESFPGGTSFHVLLPKATGDES